jgi:four helix bundle protein
MREWIDELEDRTKAFGLNVMRLAEMLEETRVPGSVLKQLVKAATRVGANNRTCRRTRSTGELVSKLSVVQEEADESVYWLETVRAIPMAPPVKDEVVTLQREATELRAIFSAARATAKRRHAEELRRASAHRRRRPEAAD